MNFVWHSDSSSWLSEICRKQAIAVDQLRRGQSLITELKQVGVLNLDVNVRTSDEIIAALQGSLKWTPSSTPLHEQGRVSELRREVDEQRAAFRGIQAQIEASEAFQRGSRVYASEAGQQVLRLESIGLFDGIQALHQCPICSSNVEQTLPSVSALTASLRQLESELLQVELERPPLTEYIVSFR